MDSLYDTSPNVGTAGYSTLDVLTFRDVAVEGFWQIWMSIFVWMTASYALVHFAAFITSIYSLRHHSWVVALSSPFLVMATLGPLTLGALTSAAVALPFAMVNKSLGPWHCMLLGCGQTALVVLTSFTRMMATL